MRKLTLVAVVLLVGTPLGVPKPAEASYEGIAGRVAFTESHRLEGGWYEEIYTMNADGTDRRRITSDGGKLVKTEYDEEYGGFYNVYSWNSDATWSPDGSALAFLHYGTGDRIDIRAVDADGRNPRTLFRDWRGTMITWSPDGKRIAYGEEEGLWVADADGSDAKRIAVGTRGLGPLVPPEVPALFIDVEWSPDGERLAYIEYSGRGMVSGFLHVGVIDVDGTNRRTDVCTVGWGASFTIDWAPNGRRLWCDHQDAGSVLSVEPDGTNLEPVAAGWGPVASPDGSGLLYLRGHVVEDQELWSYDIASQMSTLLAVDFWGFDLDWQPRQGRFWDDEDSVFEADIEWLAAEGITKGCNPPDNDKYCPTGDVTRGQMAAFLVRALNLTERLDDPFRDDDDSIFEADIEKLAAAGITKGCNPAEGNTKYCPDHKVTREQMAAFLTRALGYVDDGGGDWFNDDDHSIFEHDIDKLAKAGITKGCNPPANDRYCPNDKVTREQMAAFLHRALG